MKKLIAIFCLWYSFAATAQNAVPKSIVEDYTLVELLSKATKKYDKPIARNNSVSFDYANKVIVAIDTANGLKNIYSMKNYKISKAANTYNCVDENSKMECAIQTTAVGTKKTMEIVFTNGFKIRFTKP